MLARIKHLVHRASSHAGFRRYAANTSWMFAEQLLRMVAGLLVGIWVARYLGPTQFGVFSYSIAFAALFGSLAKLGLDSIMVRDLVRTPELSDVYLGTAFWLKIMGSVVMLAAMVLAVRFTSNDATTNLYIFIIGSGTLFQSFEVVDFYFQSKVLSKFVSMCKLTQLFISSLIKLYLIYIKAELFLFVLVSLIDQITLGVSLYFAYRLQNLNNFYQYFDIKIAKKLLKDSWPLILSGIIIAIYMRIDQIMIKEFLDVKEVGLYSAAARISEIWNIIPILICNSLFPSILNAKKVSLELYAARLQKLYSLLVWLAIIVALSMTYLSERVVVFLYGNAFSDASDVLMIHIWSGIFVGLATVKGKWQVSENLNHLYLYGAGISVTSNVILNYFLIPNYGIIGAAFAALMSQIISGYLINFFFKELRYQTTYIHRTLFFWRLFK
ncbi:flippase [Rhodoferax lithotrophicus]|nr:flippase [Rhodoferax sp. MIZ03]